MEINVKELASKLSGELVGDETVLVKSIKEPQDATNDTVIIIYEKKYLETIDNFNYAAVITNNKINDINKPQIIVKDPKQALIKTLEIFSENENPIKKIHEKAIIDDSSKLADDIFIGANTVIRNDSVIEADTIIYENVYIGSNVKIGKNCIIHPNVVIEYSCEIGDNVIIHAGTVIGADGFGYINKNGNNIKIPQIGKVIISHDVEIGANCTIDRATMGRTEIGEYTKIDNLVHIAHNVKVGKNCFIAAQVGIAGSCNIGNYCMFGGQVGISDHVNIADGTIVGAQSGVAKTVKQEKSFLFGSPAKDFKRITKIYSAMDKLPDLIKRINNLESKNNND